MSDPTPKTATHATDQRDALVQLATDLDQARLAANSIEAAAHQLSAYGHIARGLQATLDLITGDSKLTETVYMSLISDGLTVPEALSRHAGQG